jgi:hypothetical protein
VTVPAGPAVASGAAVPFVAIVPAGPPVAVAVMARGRPAVVVAGVIVAVVPLVVVPV